MRFQDEIAVSSDHLDQKSFSYILACQEQWTFLAAWWQMRLVCCAWESPCEMGMNELYCWGLRRLACLFIFFLNEYGESRYGSSMGLAPRKSHLSGCLRVLGVGKDFLCSSRSFECKALLMGIWAWVLWWFLHCKLIGLVGFPSK